MIYSEEPKLEPANNRQREGAMNTPHAHIHKQTKRLDCLHSARRALTLLLLMLAMANNAIIAQGFTFNESCTGASGRFILYQDVASGMGCPVVSVGAGYTASNNVLFGEKDQPGDGWLRLTSDQPWQQTGYFLFDGAFPSEEGVQVEFDFIVWTKTGYGPDNAGNAKLGDGFTLFLFKNVPDNQLKVGSFSGCLGYKKRCNAPPCGGLANYPGLTPAYAGVAIDIYGVFSDKTCGVDFGQPNQSPHSIAIAGPDNLIKYVTPPYLEGIPTGDQKGKRTVLGYAYANQKGSGLPDADPWDTDGGSAKKTGSYNRPNFHRRIRVTFKPNTKNAAGQVQTMKIKVELQTTLNGAYYPIINDINYPYSPYDGNSSGWLRMGLAASTGRNYAYHEVRNVLVNPSSGGGSTGDVSINKRIGDGSLSAPYDLCAQDENNIVINTIIKNTSATAVTNNTIEVLDTLPPYFVPTSYSTTTSPPYAGSTSVSNLNLGYPYTMYGNCRVYKYNVNVGANVELAVTFKGYIPAANLPSSSNSCSLPTSAGISFASGFNGNSNKANDNVKSNLCLQITRPDEIIGEYPGPITGNVFANDIFCCQYPGNSVMNGVTLDYPSVGSVNWDNNGNVNFTPASGNTSGEYWATYRRQCTGNVSMGGEVTGRIKFIVKSSYILTASESEICSGNNVTLTVNCPPTSSVTWEYSTAANPTVWYPLGGSTSPSRTITPTESRCYRARVDGSATPTNSVCVTVKLKDPPALSQIETSPSPVCESMPFYIIIKQPKQAHTYRVYNSPTSNTPIAEGPTPASGDMYLLIPGSYAHNGTNLYITEEEWYDVCGESTRLTYPISGVQSCTGTVWYEPNPVCFGKEVWLHSSIAPPQKPDYWEQSANTSQTSNYTKIVGSENANPFLLPSIMRNQNDRWYRAVINGVPSNPVQVQFKPSPNMPIPQASSIWICAGSAFNINLSNTASNVLYEVYDHPSLGLGTLKGSGIGNGSSLSIQIPLANVPPSSTQQYTWYVFAKNLSDGSCPSEAAIVNIKVNEQPSAPNITAPSAVCTNNDYKITVNGGQSGNTYYLYDNLTGTGTPAQTKPYSSSGTFFTIHAPSTVVTQQWSVRAVSGVAPYECESPLSTVSVNIVTCTPSDLTPQEQTICYKECIELTYPGPENVVHWARLTDPVANIWQILGTSQGSKSFKICPSDSEYSQFTVGTNYIRAVVNFSTGQSYTQPATVTIRPPLVAPTSTFSPADGWPITHAFCLGKTYPTKIKKDQTSCGSPTNDPHGQAVYANYIYSIHLKDNGQVVGGPVIATQDNVDLPIDITLPSSLPVSTSSTIDLEYRVTDPATGCTASCILGIGVLQTPKAPDELMYTSCLCDYDPTFDVRIKVDSTDINCMDYTYQIYDEDTGAPIGQPFKNTNCTERVWARDLPVPPPPPGVTGDYSVKLSVRAALSDCESESFSLLVPMLIKQCFPRMITASKTTVCANENVTLHYTIPDPSHEACSKPKGWQDSTASSSWQNIVDINGNWADAATLNVYPTVTTHYRHIIDGHASNTVTVTVESTAAPIGIQAQPGICKYDPNAPNSVNEFTIEIPGSIVKDGDRYDVYDSPTSGSTPIISSNIGADGISMFVKVRTDPSWTSGIGGSAAVYVRRVSKFGCESLPATISLNVVDCADGTVVDNTTICKDVGSATLVLIDHQGTVNFWQRRKAGTGVFEELPGTFTKTSITVTAAEQNNENYYYRAIVNGGKPTNEVLVDIIDENVKPLFPSYTIPDSVCPGKPLKLTIKAYDNDYSYRLYNDTIAGATMLAQSPVLHSGQTHTFIVPAPQSDSTWQIRMVNGTCDLLLSYRNINVPIDVAACSNGTLHVSRKRVCFGESVTLYLVGHVGTIEKWLSLDVTQPGASWEEEPINPVNYVVPSGPYHDTRYSVIVNGGDTVFLPDIVVVTHPPTNHSPLVKEAQPIPITCVGSEFQITLDRNTLEPGYYYLILDESNSLVASSLQPCNTTPCVDMVIDIPAGSWSVSGNGSGANNDVYTWYIYGMEAIDSCMTEQLSSFKIKVEEPGFDLTPADVNTVSMSRNGSDIIFTVGVENIGTNPWPSSNRICVTLRRDSISGPITDIIGCGCLDLSADLNAGDVEYVTVTVPESDVMTPPLFSDIVVRVNEDGCDPNGIVFPVITTECDLTNNMKKVPNPASDLLNTKSSRVLTSINGSTINSDNGVYANPVSVLANEVIEYSITAYNASASAADFIIRDTLPAYMEYINGCAECIPTPCNLSITINKGQTTTTPQLDTIQIMIPQLPSQEMVTVKFCAEPTSGVVASQPMFANYAWVENVTTGTKVKTNGTYHQGAGVSVVTFSAGLGGSIFNVSQQALDYKTSPRSDALIVPDSGYVFAGWSHDEYVSLRGAIIAAQTGVMNLDTLIVYGNVELRATFLPEEKLDKDVDLDAETDDNVKVERVWSSDKTLYVHTVHPYTILRIHTAGGVLLRQQTLLSAGTSTFKLPTGLYVVTLNNGAGVKVRIW